MKKLLNFCRGGVLASLSILAMLALFAAGCSNSSSAPYIPSGGGGGGGGPTAKTIDLSTVTADTVIADNTTVTGTLGANVKISIADGATVTLKAVTINGTDDASYKWAGLTCAGDATITLEGANTLKGFLKYYPGVFVPKGKTLTIKGSGSLAANSNGYGAGIGGCYAVDSSSHIPKEEGSCGTIVIEGGTITATGGENAAGIGCGNGSDCDGVTIKGGTVTATGGTTAAGIGSAQTESSCGDILISGGTVTATGGVYAAGVGTGRGDNSKCGAITVATTVTKLKATKGEYATNSVGRARDGSSVCGTVTIGGVEGAITTSPYTYEPNPSPEPGPGTEATEPLTLEFTAAGKITFTNKPASLKYSLDGGATWRAASNEISVSAGDKVGLYANGTGTTSVSNAFKISCDADCYVYGNVMSLEKSSGFSTLVTLEGHNYAFYSLFNGNTHIKNHGTKALQLPATTLSQSCYANMFNGCTSLTKAPVLPATTLVDRCYNGMFYGCTALTSAPELKAETLANSCYATMFFKCTSLTEAPNLPATELTEGCYDSMFQLCHGLTSAPELPATTLAKSCYQRMFANCEKLVTAPRLPAETLVNNCYQYMFYGCETLASITCLATDIYATGAIISWVEGVAVSSGTFTCASAMVTTWEGNRGNNGVPTGWTVTAQ